MKKWKPFSGDKYYFFTDFLNIVDFPWVNSPGDQRRYEINNCFKTKKEAEKIVGNIKELLGVSK